MIRFMIVFLLSIQVAGAAISDALITKPSDYYPEGSIYAWSLWDEFEVKIGDTCGKADISDKYLNECYTLIDSLESKYSKQFRLTLASAYGVLSYAAQQEEIVKQARLNERNLLAQTLRQFPDDTEILFAIANIEESSNKRHELLKKIIEIDKNNTSAKVNLSIDYIGSDDPLVIQKGVNLLAEVYEYDIKRNIISVGVALKRYQALKLLKRIEEAQSYKEKVLNDLDVANSTLSSKLTLSQALTTACDTRVLEGLEHLDSCAWIIKNNGSSFLHKNNNKIISNYQKRIDHKRILEAGDLLLNISSAGNKTSVLSDFESSLFELYKSYVEQYPKDLDVLYNYTNKYLSGSDKIEAFIFILEHSETPPTFARYHLANQYIDLLDFEKAAEELRKGAAQKGSSESFYQIELNKVEDELEIID